MKTWQISVGPEGWQEILKQLHNRRHWPKKKLIDALLAEFELKCSRGGAVSVFQQLRAERSNLRRCSIGMLADAAYDLVVRNNTCDAGGWNYWIDRGGQFKVRLKKPGK